MAKYYRLPSHEVLKSKNYMWPINGKLVCCKWEDPSKPFPLAGMGWRKSIWILSIYDEAIPARHRWLRVACGNSA